MKGPIGYELSPAAERASQIISNLEKGCSEDFSQDISDLFAIIELMNVEIASRGKWIQTMNEILGYDNNDGKHCTPGPHDLAKRAVEDAWKYRQLQK